MMTAQNELLDSIRIETPIALSPAGYASLVAAPIPPQTVVTLLTPMEKKGAETRKNPIVFKNAITSAWNLLDHDQQHHRPIGSRLERLKHLDDLTDPIWQNQLGGLAVVIPEEGPVTAYRVPFSMESEAHVGGRPYLAPLLKLCDPMHYYVLALDLNETRLYEATRWGVTELPLEATPTSLGEANRFDDPEKSLQSHIVPGAGGGDAIFHGHGAANDANRRKAITHFYEVINRSLPGDLPDRDTPLVLFTDPGEAGHFRATYQATPLHGEGILQNTTSFSRDETESLITTWVGKRENERLAQGLESLGTAASTGKAATGVAGALQAASEGRVDTLFVKSGARAWGAENGAGSSPAVHDERETGDVDLIELAALRTAETGGNILVVPADRDLPGGTEIAAVLRY